MSLAQPFGKLWLFKQGVCDLHGDGSNDTHFFWVGVLMMIIWRGSVIVWSGLWLGERECVGSLTHPMTMERWSGDQECKHRGARTTIGAVNWHSVSNCCAPPPSRVWYGLMPLLVPGVWKIRDNLWGNKTRIHQNKDALVRSTKTHTRARFYSVNISDVSGSSRRLRENSGTGLYISLFYIPRC